MKRKRLLWQIYPPYAALMLVALCASSWHAFRSVRGLVTNHMRQDLAIRASLIAEQVADGKYGADAARLDELCKRLGKRIGVRITVVLPSGRVQADSHEDPARMDDHSDRPEIMAAFGGAEGYALRYSDTLRERMMYVAIPLVRDGPSVAVVRAAVSVADIEARIRAVCLRIGLVAVVLMLVAAGVALTWTRRITRPLEEMKRGAEAFAGGNLQHRLAVPDSAELAALAESMNHMAQELEQRVRSLVQERNANGAVLRSMAEGVLALDKDERILHINRAAAELFRIDGQAAVGRPIQEAVRDPETQMFARQALRSDVPVEREIVLRFEEDHCLHVMGTALRDAEQAHIGALLVLHDLTRIRRLEKIRSEFVANVSHELKTPVTAIRGFVETLLDGADQDADSRRRFLGIVARHANRLSDLIDDLLSLSRIEHEADSGQAPLARSGLRAVLDRAVRVCQPRAEVKGIRMTVDCADELEGLINAPLLEQAVVNLIDNAVKYSERDKAVEIAAARQGDRIRVRVRDQGYGIERKHLPRLFERFYRVDKGRSRDMGGTGLGLAIVRHIALAHRGAVQVESEPGVGSTFTIDLPAA